MNTLRFLRKYWWIILVTIILFGIALAIYILITPPPTEYTAYTIAKLIFDFLDRWASAGAPAITLVGILVALFIGIQSLRQTQTIQKSQERDRLLKELDKISEWAQNLVDFTTDRDDNLRSAKELTKHRTTGGSLKRQYSGVFSTIVDSEEMRNAFNNIDALMAFVNSQPYDLNSGYAKAPELENNLHTSAENILIKADNARSLLRQP